MITLDLILDLALFYISCFLYLAFMYYFIKFMLG